MKASGALTQIHTANHIKRDFFVARITQKLQIKYYYDVAVEITSFSGVHPLCQINRIKEVTPYSPSTPVRQPSRSSSPSNKRFLPNQILLFRLPLRKKKKKTKTKQKTKDKKTRYIKNHKKEIQAPPARENLLK